MKDVAEEVPIVKLCYDVFFEIGRQAFSPLLIIASEGSIESDDILHFALVDSIIADGCPGSYKPMKHRLFRLRGIASKPAAIVENLVKEPLGFVGNLFPDLENEVVLELIAKFEHPLGEHFRKNAAEELHSAVH